MGRYITYFLQNKKNTNWFFVIFFVKIILLHSGLRIYWYNNPPTNDQCKEHITIQKHFPRRLNVEVSHFVSEILVCYLDLIFFFWYVVFMAFCFAAQRWYQFRCWSCRRKICTQKSKTTNIQWDPNSNDSNNQNNNKIYFLIC